MDLEGYALTPDESEMLTHPLVGGIILFTRNFESKAQLKALCEDIRLKRRDKPVLIMVDQEGGRVQRFKTEFTRLPPAAEFGQIYDEDPNRAIKLAKEGGKLMAAELLAIGVDLSFAPVLDLNKGVSSVIGDRAFHTNTAAVTTLASAFIAGMNEAGMAATGKHFPGHGSVVLDSHLALPTDERSYEDIEKDDLIPFANLIQQGIPALMAAHITFPRVDKYPVGYSAVWLKNILRKKLNFSGVIFSDDLSMEGANISADYADRVKAANEAGCDFTLICNHRAGVIQALDLLPHSLQVSGEKWLPLKGRFNNKFLN